MLKLNILSFWAKARFTFFVNNLSLKAEVIEFLSMTGFSPTISVLPNFSKKN